jgi:hypothetical protein
VDDDLLEDGSEHSLALVGVHFVPVVTGTALGGVSSLTVVGRGDAAVVREWESVCWTAKLQPDVFWSARTVYLRYVRWTGELWPGYEKRH